MAFENSDLKTLKPLLDKSVFESFKSVVDDRQKKQLSIEASFIGMRDIRITNVYFDKKINMAEITVAFKSEISTVVKDKTGKVIEGDPNEIKKQKDIWTFSKKLTDKKPIWLQKARIIKQWSGVRSKPDGEPSPIMKNLGNGLIVCTGFYKNGILLAPACSKWVANEIKNYFY